MSDFGPPDSRRAFDAYDDMERHNAYLSPATMGDAWTPLRMKLTKVSHEAHRDRLIYARNGADSAIATADAAQLVLPFWDDPRNVMLSNLIRQWSAPVKDPGVRTSNTFFTLLTGTAAFLGGEIGLFLGLHMAYSLADWIFAYYAPQATANYMMGSELQQAPYAQKAQRPLVHASFSNMAQSKVSDNRASQVPRFAS